MGRAELGRVAMKKSSSCGLLLLLFLNIAVSKYNLYIGRENGRRLFLDGSLHEARARIIRHRLIQPRQSAPILAVVPRRQGALCRDPSARPFRRDRRRSCLPRHRPALVQVLVRGATARRRRKKNLRGDRLSAGQWSQSRRAGRVGSHGSASDVETELVVEDRRADGIRSTRRCRGPTGRLLGVSSVGRPRRGRTQSDVSLVRVRERQQLRGKSQARETSSAASAALLLHSGAKATIVDRRGKSLLHCVADWRGPLAPYHRNDHYGAAMVQSLCEHGAGVNCRLGGKASGATPLGLAVRNLNYAVARVLVANGAEATELLDYRRYFPVGGTDVVNADTIVRTYYMSVAVFKELRPPRIAKMLDFLERTPWIKSVEGFNALIKWVHENEKKRALPMNETFDPMNESHETTPEDRIRDYFDDVWLALEDEQLPRELDEIAWAALKLPVERAYTTMLLARFHRSRETDRLFSYMEHTLPGFIDILSGMRVEVENEVSRADSLTLGANLTLLDFCRRDPAIAHEPEVYEALRTILDDDFESSKMVKLIEASVLDIHEVPCLKAVPEGPIFIIWPSSNNIVLLKNGDVLQINKIIRKEEELKLKLQLSCLSYKLFGTTYI
ncbi:unnamed protein product [Trichogramma brassicae]|uniref:Uncharacterized protein n=1 Tax=Trichogramma brassicae TaxID=86971 RepID=A0A6H5I619_9HYME|nr:unnamed protein product [Trichogramma brassicae]